MESYIAPGIREQFETLSDELKDCILQRNVQLSTMPELISELEKIVEEGES